MCVHVKKMYPVIFILTYVTKNFSLTNNIDQGLKFVSRYTSSEILRSREGYHFSMSHKNKLRI
jgi:hypothetical protein